MEGRLLRLLRLLREHNVAFILVGGLSGVLQGAPIHTQDVDIVPRRDADNVARLLELLQEIDARYRAQPERQLRPTARHLASSGHQNLTTTLGWLDILGEIGRSQGYEELLGKSHELEIAEGLQIRVLDLEAYIALKEQLGGEKDRAVLPTLRRTLEERNRARQR